MNERQNDLAKKELYVLSDFMSLAKYTDITKTADDQSEW